MPNYVIKIPLLNMPLSQAKSIIGGVYELIDDDPDMPGEVSSVFLTEGEISDSDIEQDERLEIEFGKHYRAGINENPLPDDFPVVD